MRSLNLYQPELVPVLSRIVYKFGWLEMRGGDEVESSYNQ